MLIGHQLGRSQCQCCVQEGSTRAAPQPHQPGVLTVRLDRRVANQRDGPSIENSMDYREHGIYRRAQTGAAQGCPNLARERKTGLGIHFS